jgi:hypothetical protein
MALCREAGLQEFAVRAKFKGIYDKMQVFSHGYSPAILGSMPISAHNYRDDPIWILPGQNARP